MSESPQFSILDFHSPRRPSSQVQRKLSAWHHQVCAQVQEAWATLMARPAKLTARTMEPVQYDRALARLPEDGLGLYLTLGKAVLPSMIVFSGRQVQALVSDLLDVPGEEWPAVRKLTTVEDAMLELMFQKLAESMGDAWPDSQPLPCRFLETTFKPRRTRLFPIGSSMLVGEIVITSRFGEETCQWLMLKDEVEQLLIEHFGDAAQEDGEFHPALQSLAEKIPVQVTVQLGQADLSMSQAAELAVGDVLVLDQFVSRPLIATIADQPKWAGIPTRIGSRQGFEITHVLDSERSASQYNF